MDAQTDIQFVNGLTGDPAVTVTIPPLQIKVLFDLGVIDSMSNKELLKIKHIFVSQTHIDHFIGFDRLLRVNIPHFRKIYLAGPKGMIDRVSAKLNGYTWNLLDPGQLQFFVTEVHGDGLYKRAQLRNDTAFTPEDWIPEIPPGDALIKFPKGGSVKGIPLDHGTDSISYRIDTPSRWTVCPDAIEQLGLEKGPWIKNLQVEVAKPLSQQAKAIDINGVSFETKELTQKILTPQAPYSVGYITDIAFSQKNVDSIKALLTGVSTLICEASFQDAEQERASKKLHLTTRQAALLAARLGAKNLKVFHFSNIYAQSADVSLKEAQRFFEGYKKQSQEDLDAEISRLVVDQ